MKRLLLIAALAATALTAQAQCEKTKIKKRGETYRLLPTLAENGMINAVKSFTPASPKLGTALVTFYVTVPEKAEKPKSFRIEFSDGTAYDAPATDKSLAVSPADSGKYQLRANIYYQWGVIDLMDKTITSYSIGGHKVTLTPQRAERLKMELYCLSKFNNVDAILMD
ncbi:hypothetical protein [Rufibacter ruber]|uniref:hypothetical protein n=1 Tax=Rufibacter ruber TaxID=1783499 RepID=UPI00082CA543|nr:hypothetical protein [Rufibacter ruber]